MLKIYHINIIKGVIMKVSKPLTIDQYSRLKKEYRYLNEWVKSFGRALKYGNDSDIYQFRNYLEGKSTEITSILNKKEG